MRLGIVLPSYKDDYGRWKSYFTRLVHSFEHIDDLEASVVLLINFQRYQDDERNELMSLVISMLEHLELDWEVEDISAEYSTPVSMVTIRNDCMMIDPSCDIYLFIDDDMKFNGGAGQHYNEILNFFDNEPSLGMVMSAGFLGGYNYVGKLKYATRKHWQVGRGMFLRNITHPHSPVYSDSALKYHRGGYEDMMAAYEMLASGYKLATYFNNPTSHKGMHSDVGVDISLNSRYVEDSIHDIQITFPSISEYLKEEFSLSLNLSRAKDLINALPLIEQIGAGVMNA